MPTWERARAYLRVIENRASEEDLATFFAPEVVLEKFPNRLVPKLVKSTLADMVRESAQGKKSVSQQTYTYATPSPPATGLHFRWTGRVLAVASLQAGATMRAYFAMFLHFRDGNIVHQSN